MLCYVCMYVYIYITPARDIPDDKFENHFSKPLTTKEISLFVKRMDFHYTKGFDFQTSYLVHRAPKGGPLTIRCLNKTNKKTRLNE